MCSRRSDSCARSAVRIRSITTIRFRPGRSSRTGACLMFKPLKFTLAMAGAVIFAFPACAEQKKPFGYGTPATQQQIAGWDIDARGDDGAGLPPGKGNVSHGAEIFSEQCAACHG